MTEPKRPWGGGAMSQPPSASAFFCILCHCHMQLHVGIRQSLSHFLSMGSPQHWHISAGLVSIVLWAICHPPCSPQCYLSLSSSRLQTRVWGEWRELDLPSPPCRVVMKSSVAPHSGISLTTGVLRASQIFHKQGHCITNSALVMHPTTLPWLKPQRHQTEDRENP
jgi:hypothetical protein